MKPITAFPDATNGLQGNCSNNFLSELEQLEFDYSNELHESFLADLARMKEKYNSLVSEDEKI